jgi:serine/threonine-protein kinase
MEHCAGGTVADRLRQPTPVPRAAAMRWLEGAASALDYAHSRDIVHRDVKPGNLLLDNAGRVAVADFGIARIATDSALTQTGQVLGTAAYLSPEQALGKPATAASDRYALAVVAYELLAGRKPFDGELPAAQARQHIESPVPPAARAAGLPAAVDGVLERGLAKNPADRPLSATAFVDDLRGALGDVESTAPAAAATAATSVAPARFRRDPTPPPATGPVREQPSRRPFLIALAAIVFVLAAVIAAIAGGGAGNDNSPTRAATTQSKAAAKRPATKKAKAKAKPKPAATTPAQATTQAPPPTTDKSALARQGHSLIAQGNYAAAIDVLGQAVKDCPVSTTDPCAYALFDLGHALRLAGRPAEAIPVLQQRLQNPDQRDVVQRELDLAEAAVNGGGTAGPGKGHGKGKGKKD